MEAHLASIVPITDSNQSFEYRRAKAVVVMEGRMVMASDPVPVVWPRHCRLAVIVCSVILSWAVLLAPFVYFL